MEAIKCCHGRHSVYSMATISSPDKVGKDKAQWSLTLNFYYLQYCAAKGKISPAERHACPAFARQTSNGVFTPL